MDLFFQFLRGQHNPTPTIVPMRQGCFITSICLSGQPCSIYNMYVRYIYLNIHKNIIYLMITFTLMKFFKHDLIQE